MKRVLHLHLTRRESQIMDILFRLHEASVSEVVRHMPDEPTYNTVRNTLGTLEKKGYVKHRQTGKRYLYTPTVHPGKARQSAARHLLQTFFDGSPSAAIVTLLGVSTKDLTRQDLDDIARLIEEAKKNAKS